MATHAATRYINEAHIFPHLDAWIASLANPEDLAHSQDTDPAEAARATTFRAQLKDLDAKIAGLVTAIESGGATISQIVDQISVRNAEGAQVQVRLDRMSRAPSALTPEDISLMMAALGGMSAVLAEASPGERRAIYESLGMRLEYDARLSRMTAAVDLGVSLDGVRGGTCPLATRVLTWPIEK